MSNTSSEYIAFIAELFAPLGAYHDISQGKFFGGHAFKAEGRQFAMIIGNQCYLCVNDHTRPRFEEEGMKPFEYDKKNTTVKVRKYYQLPERLLDETEELLEWAEEAIEAAFSYPK